MARFVWATLCFNVGVVLWGAIVRATGSGAGCGNKWPGCGGSVLGTSAKAQTIVEFIQDFTSDAPTLLHFRLFHPVLAIIAGTYVTWVVLKKLVTANMSSHASMALIILLFTEIGIGLLNVLLLAPVWLQILHLLVADTIWISLVLAWSP